MGWERSMSTSSAICCSMVHHLSLGKLFKIHRFGIFFRPWSKSQQWQIPKFCPSFWVSVMVNSGLGVGAGFTCSKLPSRPLAPSIYRLQLLFALTKTCVTERPLFNFFLLRLMYTNLFSSILPVSWASLQPRFSRMFWFLSDSDANAFRACKMY